VHRDQAFELHGFASGVGTGSARIVCYDRPARWRRAFAALARWWAIALLCVVIPVAHFVLVPSFCLFGVYTFVQRFATTERATVAHGRCPDCGTEQPLELAARWHVPQAVTCRHCRRGLTLTLPAGGSS
jgi:hypothetical protein